MKKFWLLFGILFCTFALYAEPKRELDIRQYIEKYSKNGDDTEAFRQAIKDIAKGGIDIGKGGILHLPAGSYYLSDTVDITLLSQNGEIRGDGYPEIKMKDPSKDILFSQHVWKLKIHGISFVGGKNQLALGNSDIDRTNIFIVNCKFHDASGFAIRLGDKTMSAHVLIDQCTFTENRQVLLNTADWARLSNSWLTTSPEMRDQAVIVNRGCLTLDHILGVPLSNRKIPRQRWIDNYGLKLTCRDVRFGGEHGGMAIVYNYRKFRKKYPVVASSILLTDCWLYCTGTQVVRFFEIPNQTRIEDCTGVNVDSRFFTFEPAMSRKLQQEWEKGDAGLVSITTARTRAAFDSEAPDFLREVVSSRRVKFIPVDKMKSGSEFRWGDQAR